MVWEGDLGTLLVGISVNEVLITSLASENYAFLAGLDADSSVR